MECINTVKSLTLLELEPYIKGKEYIGESKDIPRLDKEVFEDFLTLLEQDQVAKEIFKAYESDKDFYKSLPDFEHFIPKAQRQEVFYAAKVSKPFREIPSLANFLIEKAYKEAHGIPNLIPLILPVPVLNKFFSRGYFMGGLTLVDAIRNICCPEYTPLSNTKLKNKMNGYVEVYIPSTNMVAALPTKLGDMLDDNTINNIEMGECGLCVNGQYLKSMCNYLGVTGSHYDLRKLI